MYDCADLRITLVVHFGGTLFIDFQMVAQSVPPKCATGIFDSSALFENFEDVTITPSPHPLIVTRDLYFCNLRAEISLRTNFQPK